MIDYERLWDDRWGEQVMKAPLDQAILALCEAKYGVKFPPSLVETYRRHNGGVLRECDSPEYLMPLSADDTADFGQCIRPVTSYKERREVVFEDQLEWIEEEYGDPALIFPLYTDGHFVYALNFNERGREGEPSIVYIDFECCNNEDVAESFGQWIESLQARDNEPLVDWEESGYCGTLIARETLDVEHPSGETQHIKQMLCQDGDELVLFTRTSGPGEAEELSKVTLPRDFDVDWATIWPSRPESCRTYVLHLQPRDFDDIRWVTSKQTGDGKWKNEESERVPVYCTFESKDRAKLEKLRAKLMKGKVPKSVIAEEKMQEQYEGMSDDERSAAFAHQLLAGIRDMDQKFAEENRDLSPVPDELRLAVENIELAKKRMLEDLERRTHDRPVDPEFMQNVADTLTASGEMVDFDLADDSHDEKPRAERASPPPSPEIATLQVLQHSFLRQLDVLHRRCFESDHPNPRAIAIHMRVVQGFMRVQAEVYRIQHGVPEARRHLSKVIGQMQLS